MIRDLFGSAKDTWIYGALSTLIFTLVFIAILVRAFLMKKQTLNEYSRMPLDENTKESDQNHEV